MCSISDNCLVLRFTDGRAITNYAKQDYSGSGILENWTVALWFNRHYPGLNVELLESLFSYATTGDSSGELEANAIYVGLLNDDNKSDMDEFQFQCMILKKLENGIKVFSGLFYH